MNSIKLKQSYSEDANRQFLCNIAPSTNLYSVMSHKIAILKMWLLWKYIVRIGRGCYWLRVIVNYGTVIRGCECSRFSNTGSDNTSRKQKLLTYSVTKYFVKKKYIREGYNWILWNKFCICKLLYVLVQYYVSFSQTQNYSNKLNNRPGLMAAQSRVWAYGRSLAGVAGSNPAGRRDVCLFRLLCFLVGVYATGREIARRSPTKHGVSNWVLMRDLTEGLSSHENKRQQFIFCIDYMLQYNYIIFIKSYFLNLLCF
jgi:hypothetical protein